MPTGSGESLLADGPAAALNTHGILEVYAVNLGAGFVANLDVVP